MTHKHIFYGPKEYGWSKEKCILCGKVKPKHKRKKALAAAREGT